jgi:hypothetical protein
VCRLLETKGWENLNNFQTRIGRVRAYLYEALVYHCGKTKIGLYYCPLAMSALFEKLQQLENVSQTDHWGLFPAPGLCTIQLFEYRAL